MKEEELDLLTRELLEIMIQVSSRFREERRWKGGEDLSVPQIILLLKGVITRMVDRLLDKGLITRTRNPRDRRVVFLSLTPRGKRLATRLEREKVEEIKVVLRSIPERERRDLLDLFQRIRDYLDSSG